MATQSGKNRLRNVADSTQVVEAAAAVERFRDAGAALRAELRDTDTFWRRLQRHLERGGSMGDLDRVGDVAERRAELSERLRLFEEARHEAHHQLFLLAAEEGTTAAEIGRTWGISRQLVSRVLRGGGPH